MALIDAIKAMPPPIVQVVGSDSGTPPIQRPDGADKVSTGQNEVEKVSTGQQPEAKIEVITVYTKERIVENGKEYTRETHPLLFAVVDWLEVTVEHRQSSVRKIAAEFEASTGRSDSKSWTAVAKNYWMSQANT